MGDNATGQIDQFAMDMDRRAARTNAVMDQFKRRWRPDDPHERPDFERDLLHLVLRIHQESADAFGAAAGRYTGILSAAIPVPPIIFKR